MRIYLELYEIIEEGEGDFIRIDVTEWSERDVDEALELLAGHAREAYTAYVIQKHFCFHEEDQPCYVDIVDVRS